MTTRNRGIDADDCLWFFMSRRSGTASDLIGEVEVNISYANPDSDRYVSVSDRARIAENPDKARALWSKMAKAALTGKPPSDLGESGELRMR